MLSFENCMWKGVLSPTEVPVSSVPRTTSDTGALARVAGGDRRPEPGVGLVDAAA